jgi:hypothetical protein
LSASAGRGVVGVQLVEVRARRDDFVDPVEHVVAEHEVGSGQQIREVLGRARPDERGIPQTVGRAHRAGEAAQLEGHAQPVVGELRLRYETLRLPDDPDQDLVRDTAEPGSESERGLLLLASWITEAGSLEQARQNI